MAGIFKGVELEIEFVPSISFEMLFKKIYNTKSEHEEYIHLHATAHDNHASRGFSHNAIEH